MTTEHIDCTPNWTGLMPVLITVLQNGTTEGQQMAKEELMRLAKEVDALNTKQKEMK